MSTFIMLGKYTPEAVKGISTSRTENAKQIIQNAGGEMQDMLALLGGPYDLMFKVDFPGIKEAMQASVSLTCQTGISFSTLPSVNVQELDSLCTSS